MVSQGSFKSFTTVVSTSLDHGLRTIARVPAASVKASLLEEVMVVEGNRLGNNSATEYPGLHRESVPTGFSVF